MKKEFIDIVIKDISVDDVVIKKVANVAAIKIDDGVYYISSKMKENKDKIGLANYSVVDAKTGLAITFGISKQDVLAKYKRIIDRYITAKNSKHYEESIQAFKEYSFI